MSRDREAPPAQAFISTTHSVKMILSGETYQFGAVNARDDPQDEENQLLCKCQVPGS